MELCINLLVGLFHKSYRCWLFFFLILHSIFLRTEEFYYKQQPFCAYKTKSKPHNSFLLCGVNPLKLVQHIFGLPWTTDVLLLKRKYETTQWIERLSCELTIYVKQSLRTFALEHIRNLKDWVWVPPCRSLQ